MAGQAPRVSGARRSAALLTLTLSAATAGCGLWPSGGEEEPKAPAPSEAPAPAATPAPPEAPAPRARSDLDDEAGKLLAADRAFAARALEVGAPAAFREYYDPNGMRLSATSSAAIGPAAVQASLAAGPPRVLSWEPRYAEVFVPGNAGWTWGDWQAYEPGAGGRRVAQGRYVSVWKKQRDGSWKVRGELHATTPGN